MRLFLVVFLCITVSTSAETVEVSRVTKIGGAIALFGMTAFIVTSLVRVHFVDPSFGIGITCGDETVFGRCCTLVNDTIVDHSNCSTPVDYDVNKCRNGTKAQCEMNRNKYVNPFILYGSNAATAQTILQSTMAGSGCVFAVGYVLIFIDILRGPKAS